MGLRHSFFLAAIAAAPASCCHCHGATAPQAETRALSLAMPIDVAIIDQTVGDDVLAAVSHNATAKASLAELERCYSVQARREGPTYSLLLCTKDRSRAILEDVGCTPNCVDYQWWQTDPGHPCSFQADAQQACAHPDSCSSAPAP